MPGTPMSGKDTRATLQRALEHKDALFRSVVAAMKEGVIIQRADGAVVDCNAAAASILGISEQDLRAKPYAAQQWSVVDAGALPVPDDQIPLARAFKTGEAQLDEVIGVDRPGRPRRWIRTSILPMTDSYSQEQGLVAVTLSDITEEREKTDRLSEALRKAEEASRTKTAFIAALSHEVRTPLNGIVGVLQAMLRDPSAPDIKQKIALLNRATLSLKHVVDDAVDIGRMDSGRFKKVSQVFDLRACLRDCGAICATLAQDKGLTFREEISESCNAIVCGDEGRLRQILTNLLSNSYKFTPSGEIVLHASLNPRAEPAELVVEIADTGIGVSEAFAPQLFDSFTRAENASVQDQPGSGLGLYLAREIARQLGGSLDYRPNAPQGSVFVLKLPWALAPESLTLHEHLDAAPQAGATVLPSRTLRVLAAEDHPLNREVIKLLLEPFAVDLVFAHDGLQARDLLRADGFDLILMDVQMPGLSGLDVLRDLRARETADGLARTPALCLSAAATKQAASEAMAAGADRYVAKPIVLRDLLDAINAVLQP